MNARPDPSPSLRSGLRLTALRMTKPPGCHPERSEGSSVDLWAITGLWGIDSRCKVRNGKAQIPDHVNPPSMAVLCVVERVVARNSLLYHHVTSGTMVEMINVVGVQA
jgi:hypothetical protein